MQDRVEPSGCRFLNLHGGLESNKVGWTLQNQKLLSGMCAERLALNLKQRRSLVLDQVPRIFLELMDLQLIRVCKLNHQKGAKRHNLIGLFVQKVKPSDCLARVLFDPEHGDLVLR